MDLKKIDAPSTTTTYNRNAIDEQTNNIYEAISIISRRAEQINSEIKKEVSKFYEKLPKPHALAVKEWLDNKIYYRNTEEDNKK